MSAIGLLRAGAAAAQGARRGRIVVAPVNTAPPSIIANAFTIGGELEVFSPGTWTPAPSAYTYQWYRDGVAIGGETSTIYVPVAADIHPDVTITCEVTATNGAGSSAPEASNGLSWSWSDLGTARELDLDMAIVTLDGSSKVSAVADQSGNGRDFTQTDPTKRFSVSTLNGRACISNAGALRYLQGPSLAGLTEGHAFVVFQLDADPPATGGGGFWDFGSTALATHFTFGSTIYDGFGTTDRKTTVNPGPSLTVPRLYEAISRPGEWTSRLDGGPLYTTATNVVGWGATSYIGADKANLSAMWLDGKIGRLIVFGAKITGSPLADVYAYIENEHGLTLP